MSGDLMLPPYIYPSEVEAEPLDAVGLFQPEFGFAIAQRIDYGASRRRFRVRYEKLRDSERAALLAVVETARRGRVLLVPLHGEAQRGSFPVTELLSNNTFANGTTGWTADNCVLTVSDRMARMTVTTPAANVQLRQSVALTQYAPHVLRGFIVDGPQTDSLSIGPSLTLGASQSSQAYSTARGLKTVVGVAEDATSRSQFPAVFSSVTGFAAGAYLSVPYTSLARCALVDNGPNLALHSDDFTNAAWVNTRSTDAANTSVAPDGTATGDNIIEDVTASDTHHIAQDLTVGSGAADYCFAVALQPNSRTFARISLREGTGSHQCFVDVNLSTGALGTPTASGANWTNPRAFVVSLGSTWNYVCIIGRKTNAATTVTPIIYLASALGTISYTGDGASNIRAWRGTVAQSSVPVRLTQTTTAAIASGTAQTGRQLYTKGWPASTDGLLRAGDFTNIILPDALLVARLAAPVNSDAAGLALLELDQLLPQSPADNAAVIINQPFAKAVLVAPPRIKTSPPGFQTEVELELEEVFG